MKLIVGLGNPGKKYEHTRHNVGFEILDRCRDQFGSGTPKRKFEGQILDVAIANQQAMLLWPYTYMNVSGRCVRSAADFYRLDLGELLVVCDDLNLPLGKLRLRARGSSGGQKGLQSIIQQLGTEEFCRLRIGVGPVPQRWDPADFVLGKFTKQERATVVPLVAQAIEAIECWAARGIDESMNLFN